MPGTLPLHQAVALEAGLRTTTYRKVTDLWKNLQKQPLFSGLYREYRPAVDGGEQLAPESTQVQLSAEAVLRTAARELTRQWDMTATRDYGNCTATADVAVDGQILITAAPVHYLLFLQKQLSDLRAVILN